MSEESGDVSEAVNEGLEWLRQWYHVPSVVLLFVFALWVRARFWGEFVIDGEVLFSGNDAWYHLRQVTYTTKHWPETMPYDVWTNFPRGTSVAQFGTIYDQAIATVALIVGLGNPSPNTIALVHLFAPAVAGALIVIPTYYLGKRLGRSRLSGLLAAVVFVLSAGGLLRRSTAGFSDHHVAEALMQAVAVLAIVVALQVADREKPVWELAVERNIPALRRPLGYATLGGIGLALYVWVWPPGVLLIGILGLYVTVQSAISYLRGESPEHMLFASAVVFAVAGVLLLLPLDTVGIGTLEFTLLQPGLALAGVIWCGTLAWMGRLWDEQSLPAWTYPITALGIIGTTLLLLALVAPNKFELLTDQLVRVFGRLFGFQPSAAASTVGEVQPFQNTRQRLRWYYGLAHVVAGFGILLALARQVVADKPRSELLLVVVWGLTVFAATLTQARFSYYLTVPVAVLSAYALGSAIRYVGELESDDDGRILEPYQIMAVFTALVLIVAPMAMIQIQGERPADVLSQSETNGPGGGIQGWSSSLDWMAENTPEQGQFEGVANDLDYYGEFAKVDDFEYDAGTYGVLSWWDYGHWITAKGERIPVANPFQQSATEAARFLLASDEQEGNNVLATNMSDGDNRETRYVMVDWKMATTNADPRIGRGKFFAPPAFLDNKTRTDYYWQVFPRQVTQAGIGDPVRPYFTIHKQAYYETMVSRLYRYHGSAAWPDYVSTGPMRQQQSPPYVPDQFAGANSNVPVVNINELGEGAATVPDPSRSNGTDIYPNLDAATQAVQNSSGAQIGGIGKYPSEHVSALQHYRLVQVSDQQRNQLTAIHPGLAFNLNRQATYSGMRQGLQWSLEPYPAWTKVFERVPGATIEGAIPDAPTGTSVYATTQVRIPTTNNTFEYIQKAETDADGSFTMTVPYSTTGYDNWGTEEGYTNASVRAVSDYTIISESVGLDGAGSGYYNTSVDISEAKVIGEDTTPASVTIEEPTPLLQRNSTGGNESAESGSSNLRTDDGFTESITHAEPLGSSRSLLGAAEVRRQPVG